MNVVFVPYEVKQKLRRRFQLEKVKPLNYSIKKWKLG